jgi:hypothetical protein
MFAAGASAALSGYTKVGVAIAGSVGAIASGDLGGTVSDYNPNRAGPVDRNSTATRAMLPASLATSTLNVDPYLLANLAKSGKELREMYLGAVSALEARLPDYGRHFGSSLREAIMHFLRRHAPDDAIRAWTKRPDYYDKHGRPTRRARAAFIIVAHGGDSNAADELGLAVVDNLNDLHALAHGEVTIEHSRLQSLRSEAEALLHKLSS